MGADEVTALEESDPQSFGEAWRTVWAVRTLRRQFVATVVSSQNRCFYCITDHGNAVRQLGDPVLGEMMVMNYRAARLNKHQRAMLDAMQTRDELYAVLDYHTYERKLDALNAKGAGSAASTVRKPARRRTRKR